MLKPTHHIIVGLGNWGGWLADTLVKYGDADVSCITRRTDDTAIKTNSGIQISRYNPSKKVKPKTIIWLCTPDDMLNNKRIKLLATLQEVYFVHCSGSSDVFSPHKDVLGNGAFWPIQSFRKSKEPDWNNIPFVIQTDNQGLTDWLYNFGKQISKKPVTIAENTKQRRALHLGAVYTQNFTNLLWSITSKIAQENGLDHRILIPLTESYLPKLYNHAPETLQTGPAIRHDEQTIKAHLELLRANPEASQLYQTLTNAIQQRTKECEEE